MHPLFWLSVVLGLALWLTVGTLLGRSYVDELRAEGRGSLACRTGFLCILAVWPLLALGALFLFLVFWDLILLMPPSAKKDGSSTR